MNRIIAFFKSILSAIKRRFCRIQCPVQWDASVNPFSLPYKNFKLKKILGYSRTSNHVFRVEGIYQHKKVNAYIKVAEKSNARIKKEIETLSMLKLDVLPQIIDHDDNKDRFVVTLAKEGAPLHRILGNNADGASAEYMPKFGKMLASLHQLKGNFDPVIQRPYFDIPALAEFEKVNLQFVYDYLVKNKPKTINKCFCHGDFNYSNVLWQNKQISAVLDLELSGIGNREYDIAWAMAVRPKQSFLITPQEIQLFLDGYRTLGDLNIEHLKYYLVLVYSHFYLLIAKNEVYQKYILRVFYTICLETKS